MQMSWRRKHQLERYCIRLNWLPFLKPLIIDKGGNKAENRSILEIIFGRKDAPQANKRRIVIADFTFSADGRFEQITFFSFSSDATHADLTNEAIGISSTIALPPIFYSATFVDIQRLVAKIQSEYRNGTSGQKSLGWISQL